MTYAFFVHIVFFKPSTIKESVHEKKSINQIGINISHMIIFISLKSFVIRSGKYLLHLRKSPKLTLIHELIGLKQILAKSKISTFEPAAIGRVRYM